MAGQDKQSAMNNLKSEIIVHVLDYIDDNNFQEKGKAIGELNKFAKFYTVSIKKEFLTPNNKKYLKKFILNKEGYIVTISNLFNSLNNG